MAIVEDTRPREARNDPEALIREARELHRRRWRRRAVAGLVGVLLLAAGGIATFGGGGSPAGVALHGPLPAGLAARAADPMGGLPWGIRVVRTHGWTCVQLGRLRGRQLGLLGRDGTVGNDGRFHPFGPSTTYQARCARNDRHDHAFMNVQLGAEPASGAGGGYTGMTQCRTAAELAQFKRSFGGAQSAAEAAIPPLSSVCPPTDLRFIQYGLLGPKAAAVTYTLGGVRQMEQTHGPDGAYLVVGGPTTTAFCDRFGRTGVCGRPGIGSGSVGGGMIREVRYRNAPPCRIGSRIPAFFAVCPRVGYVTPTPPLTQRQVAASVTARLITAESYCLSAQPARRVGFGAAPVTDLGPYHPCTGHMPVGAQPPGDVIHGTLIRFSWTARQPVSSRNSQYRFLISNDRCGGQGGGTYGKITAGERLTRAVILPTRRCIGPFTITVGYDPDLSPGGGSFAGDSPGQDGSLLVGRVTLTR